MYLTVEEYAWLMSGSVAVFDPHTHVVLQAANQMLIAAVKNNNYEDARQALSQGADLNCKDSFSVSLPGTTSL